MCYLAMTYNAEKLQLIYFRPRIVVQIIYYKKNPKYCSLYTNDISQNRNNFDIRDKLLPVYNMASSGLMKMLILIILYTQEGVSLNVCSVFLF